MTRVLPPSVSVLEQTMVGRNNEETSLLVFHDKKKNLFCLEMPSVQESLFPLIMSLSV